MATSTAQYRTSGQLFGEFKSVFQGVKANLGWRPTSVSGLNGCRFCTGLKGRSTASVRCCRLDRRKAPQFRVQLGADRLYAGLDIAWLGPERGQRVRGKLETGRQVLRKHAHDARLDKRAQPEVILGAHDNRQIGWGMLADVAHEALRRMDGQGRDDRAGAPEPLGI